MAMRQLGGAQTGWVARSLTPLNPNLYRPTDGLYATALGWFHV